MFANSTTYVATSLMTTLLATALAAPSGAARAADAGGVQLAQQAPHRFTIGHVCQISRDRLSGETIRRHAHAAGYRNVDNVRFVSRRYGPDGWCGFYRADAMRQGRPFLIYADSQTGRIVGSKEQARYGRDRYQDLSVVQIRTILLNRGYDGIRSIRHVRRGTQDVFVARANWRGWVVRLWIDDETGRVVNRERLWRIGRTIETPNMSQERLRELLRSRGYRDIREVRAEPRAYDVVAYIGDVPYRIRVSVTTGEIESEYRLH